VSFNLRCTEAEERSRYTDDWRREKSLFVDDPQTAVNRADTLVQDVVQRRGYPIGDFDQNATDLSVDHPPLWNIPVSLMKWRFEKVTIEWGPRIRTRRG
jgi:hypothetical protein